MRAWRILAAVVYFAPVCIVVIQTDLYCEKCADLFGSLIATGYLRISALQVILNIAVVTGLLPTTGITLPFISYGGTAIVFLMAEMGIALGISRKIRLE